MTATTCYNLYSVFSGEMKMKYLLASSCIYERDQTGAMQWYYFRRRMSVSS